MRDMRHGVSYRGILLCVLALGIIFALGVIIGWFSHLPSSKPAQPRTDFLRVADPTITERLFRKIDTARIRDKLREFTSFNHLAGTPGDDRITKLVEDTWNAQQVDFVARRSYNVLLSYPNATDPSVIKILDQNNITILSTSTTAEKIVLNEHNVSDTVLPFHAYSPSGDVLGDLVYVNRASDDDFKRIRDDYSIDLTGKIVIAQYGSTYRGSQVARAAQYGAAAIILYLDPKTYNPDGDDSVFPDSQWLPGSAVQRGTVLGSDSDPQTPGYPSTDTAYRIPEANCSGLPTIPSHPISYDDAYKLMRLLAGPNATESWQGGFNFTYRIGPGFLNQSWKTHMHVTTFNQRMTISNVFAFINGTAEPDRYVLLGNHRDAWTFGSIDPTSGTVLMLELSRVFMELVREGWRPRRTIVFCSWAAEEYGLIGSYEWVEDYVKLLTTRAVAYLNVDYVLEGDVSLTVGAFPTLHDLIYDAAKRVKSPRYNNRTMFDDWLATFPANYNLALPTIDNLGVGSDHAGFMLQAGVPCYDAWYTTAKNNGYPLYHTAYEGFTLYDKYMDPQYKVTLAVGQFWSETVRSLSDSLLLPLNVSHSADWLVQAVNHLDKGYGELMRNNSISLDSLFAAAQNFQRAASNFNIRTANITNVVNPFLVRAYNDQIMGADRAFIDPAGLPLRKTFRNVVYAPSAFNSYAGSLFPGLTDLMYDIQHATDPFTRWEDVKQHLATVIFCFNSATAAVQPLSDFMR